MKVWQMAILGCNFNINFGQTLAPGSSLCNTSTTKLHAWTESSITANPLTPLIPRFFSKLAFCRPLDECVAAPFHEVTKFWWLNHCVTEMAKSCIIFRKVSELNLNGELTMHLCRRVFLSSCSGVSTHGRQILLKRTKRKSSG